MRRYRHIEGTGEEAESTEVTGMTDQIITLMLCLLFYLIYGFDLADCVAGWKHRKLGSNVLHLAWVAAMGLVAMMWSVITYNVWTS